jgi:hypothetical protein
MCRVGLKFNSNTKESCWGVCIFFFRCKILPDLSITSSISHLRIVYRSYSSYHRSFTPADPNSSPDLLVQLVFADLTISKPFSHDPHLVTTLRRVRLITLMTIPLLIRITGVIMIIRIGRRCARAAIRAFVLGIRIISSVVALVVCLVAAVRIVGAATSKMD